jgi:hypothetical protein
LLRSKTLPSADSALAADGEIPWPGRAEQRLLGIARLPIKAHCDPSRRSCSVTERQAVSVVAVPDIPDIAA